MTDRQIHDVYFHPREKSGELKRPPVSLKDEEEKPLTREEEREIFFGVGQAMGIPHDDLMKEWELKRGVVQNDSELP